MAEERLVLRGAEDDVKALADELNHYLDGQGLRGAVPMEPVRPVRPRLTEPQPLGNQALVELAIQIGQAVAVGVLSTVLKDQILLWIRGRAKEKGVAVEEKG